TIERLAPRLESLTRQSQVHSLPALKPTPRDSSLPLSFAQQRLWFIDQLEPGSAAYNTPTALRIEGSLRVDALQQAFSALLSRHESLRTTFASQEGQPVQVIHPASGFLLALEDLSALPEAEREEAARRRA
ncbi:condensation domain-containing protein, partial [Corallococcus sp. AB038B]|uniref:condensation domain-containing protein n=2 Tax=Myxococcaceae TaxID=31 RepID=UPI000ED945B4